MYLAAVINFCRVGAPLSLSLSLSSPLTAQPPTPPSLPLSSTRERKSESGNADYQLH